MDSATATHQAVHSTLMFFHPVLTAFNSVVVMQYVKR